MPPQTPPGAQGKASLASAPKATAGCRRRRFVRYAPLSVVCARRPAARAPMRMKRAAARNGSCRAPHLALTSINRASALPLLALVLLSPPHPLSSIAHYAGHLPLRDGLRAAAGRAVDRDARRRRLHAGPHQPAAAAATVVAVGRSPGRQQPAAEMHPRLIYGAGRSSSRFSETAHL